MRTKVNVASQVEDFVKSLAPERRRRLRMAIKALANDRGDIKRLEGGLEGYSRLRISGHRVIFAERAAGAGERHNSCVSPNKGVGGLWFFPPLVERRIGWPVATSPAHGHSRRLRLCFPLDIRPAFVKAGEEKEQHRGGEHDDHEEEEVARAFELHRMSRVFDEEIDRRSESVAERNCAQVRAHHQ